MLLVAGKSRSRSRTTSLPAGCIRAPTFESAARLEEGDQCAELARRESEYVGGHTATAAQDSRYELRMVESRGDVRQVGPAGAAVPRHLVAELASPLMKQGGAVDDRGLAGGDDLRVEGRRAEVGRPG